MEEEEEQQRQDQATAALTTLQNPASTNAIEEEETETEIQNAIPQTENAGTAQTNNSAENGSVASRQTMNTAQVMQEHDKVAWIQAMDDDLDSIGTEVASVKNVVNEINPQQNDDGSIISNLTMES